MADAPKGIQLTKNQKSLEITDVKDNTSQNSTIPSKFQLSFTFAFDYLKKTVNSTTFFSSHDNHKEDTTKSVTPKSATPNVIELEISNDQSSSPNRLISNQFNYSDRKPTESKSRSETKSNKYGDVKPGKNSQNQIARKSSEYKKPKTDAANVKVNLSLARARVRTTLKPPLTVSKNWRTLQRKFFLQYRFIGRTQRLLDQKLKETMIGTSISELKPFKRSFYDKLLIMPNSRAKWLWDLAIACNSVFQGITTYYMIGFVDFQNNQLDDTWLWIFIALDSMILMDMILHLFTAYYEKRLDLVRSPKKIIWRYVRFQIFIDILMIIPLYRYYIEGLALKTFRIRRWVFLMEQFSVLLQTLSVSISSYNAKFLVLFLTRVLKTVLWIFIAIHILACFSSFIVTYFTKTSFFKQPGDTDLTTYIRGCYFIVYTMAGVGYGDVTISFDNEFEILVGSYLQFAALGVFIFAISAISKHFNIFKAKSMFGEAKASLDLWFYGIERAARLNKAIPESIVRDTEAIVIENLEQNLDIIIRNPRYIPKLGPNLRKRLTLGLFRDFCEGYPFFFDLLESDIKAEFLSELREKTFLPNTIILSPREIPNGIYFLRAGMLYATPANNLKVFISSYTDRGIFGEELISNETLSYGLRTGDWYATCFFISCKKVMKILAKSGGSKKFLQSQMRLGRVEPSKAFKTMLTLRSSGNNKRKISRTTRSRRRATIGQSTGKKQKRSGKTFIPDTFGNNELKQVVKEATEMEKMPKRRSTIKKSSQRKRSSTKVRTKKLNKEGLANSKNNIKSISGGENPNRKKNLQKSQRERSIDPEKGGTFPTIFSDEDMEGKKSPRDKVHSSLSSDSSDEENKEFEDTARHLNKNHIKRPKDRSFSEADSNPLDATGDKLIEEHQNDLYSIILPKDLETSRIGFPPASRITNTHTFPSSFLEIAVQPSGEQNAEDEFLKMANDKAILERGRRELRMKNIVNRERDTVFSRPEYLKKKQSQKEKKQSQKEKTKKEQKKFDLDLTL